MTGKGCPFDCDCTDHPHGEYHAGMLPQTDALLERSISIGIGVRTRTSPRSGSGCGDGADEARAGRGAPSGTR